MSLEPTKTDKRTHRPKRSGWNATATRLLYENAENWLKVTSNSGDYKHAHAPDAIRPANNPDENPSLSISRRGGAKDFGDEGWKGSLVELFRLVKGHDSTHLAAKAAIETYGSSKDRDALTGTTDKGKKSKKRKRVVTPVMPIPDDAKHQLHDERYPSTWRYHDIKGNWVFSVVRYESRNGKKTLPMYYGKDGAWHGGCPLSADKPLFRINRVVGEEKEKPVLIVEGEKCASAALRAVRYAYAVTTWSGGSKAVDKSDWTPIADRDVVIWPDADEAGRAAAEEIASVLAAQNCRVRIVQPPPNVENGWDIADATEDDDEDIEGYLDAAIEWHSKPGLAELFRFDALWALLEDIAQMDDTRGECYHAFLYDNTKYAYQLAAAFLCEQLMDGAHWRLRRVDNVIFRYDKSRHYFRPIVDLTRPDKPFDLIDILQGNQRVVDVFGTKFGKKTANAKGERETKYQAFDKSRDGETRRFLISYLSEHAPADEGLLLRKPDKTVSCENGLLIHDGQTNRLEAHEAEHNQTMPSFPYRYTGWDHVDNSLKETVFKYLELLVRNRPKGERGSNVEALGLLIGYALTPYRTKRFPVLIGGNDGGKSRFLDLIYAMHRTTGTAKEADFAQMQSRPTQFDWAVFQNSLVVIHDDFHPGGKLPAQILKSVANQAKPITVEQKYKPRLTIMNKAAPYIATNANPTSDDPYLSSRLFCVRFDADFTSAEKQDPELLSLLRELDRHEVQEAFFNFGIECLQRFFREDSIDGYFTDDIRQLTDEVSGALNDAYLWLEEAMDSERLVAEVDGKVLTSKLYEMYERSRKNPVSRQKFHMQMKQRFGEPVKIGGRQHYKGLRAVEVRHLGSL